VPSSKFETLRKNTRSPSQWGSNSRDKPGKQESLPLDQERDNQRTPVRIEEELGIIFETATATTIIIPNDCEYLPTCCLDQVNCC
jgi:hypothetical protein